MRGGWSARGRVDLRSLPGASLKTEIKAQKWSPVVTSPVIETRAYTALNPVSACLHVLDKNLALSSAR